MNSIKYVDANMPGLIVSNDPLSISLNTELKLMSLFTSKHRLSQRLRESQDSHDSVKSNSKSVSSQRDNRENMPEPSAVEYSQQSGKFMRRGMDRIRRSFRESFRRKSPKHSQSLNTQSSSHRLGANGNTQSAGTGAQGAGADKPSVWQQDEDAVRAGTCSFNVKYLGCVEVYESRGMQVCEEALKVLRAQRRRTVRAILYTSGDGLRVVDVENNRGLLVDQTIEKVSFCAPDRSHEKGFAYICRDGTTRRWMCHGFHALKESGERLSHAVGCAFAVCLERKQKRDRDVQSAAAKPETESGSSNGQFGARQASFRQAPLAERLQDPQSVIIAEPLRSPAASCKSQSTVPPATAVARPSANLDLFSRQGSLRAPVPVNDPQFRRQLSLRVGDLPSNQQRTQLHMMGTRLSSTIPENEEEPNPIIESAASYAPSATTGWATPSKGTLNGLDQSQLSIQSTNQSIMMMMSAQQSHSQSAPSSARPLSNQQSPLMQPTNNMSAHWTGTQNAACSSTNSSTPTKSMWDQSFLGDAAGKTEIQQSPQLPNLFGTPPAAQNQPQQATNKAEAWLQHTLSQSSSNNDILPHLQPFTPPTPDVPPVPPRKDLFGQPDFQQLTKLEQPKRAMNEQRGAVQPHHQSTTNGLGMSTASAAPSPPSVADPFEFRWNSIRRPDDAKPANKTPTKSTNPFLNESDEVGI